MFDIIPGNFVITGFGLMAYKIKDYSFCFTLFKEILILNQFFLFKLQSQFFFKVYDDFYSCGLVSNYG